ncbi:ribonuclease H-like domain-containing protein [Clostridium neuense]|uniref:Ribonuclease H-like domain-containing protein n=1 Tax=Clostridium neuense TaxID=1728934 RepID=A0ABW8TJN6_9CLOT
MYITETERKINISPQIVLHYNMFNIAYFDIETTGFDKEKDNVILISLGYYVKDSIFKVKQYFGESLEDEKNILKNFFKDLKKFKVWCSYNGKAFDEPFIRYRMDKYKTYFDLPNEHIDLYRMIKPYKQQLKLERCNLKSVEKYAGIIRKDTIDGGMCVELYKKYLQNKDGKLRKKIMLHNFEDVLNLPSIFQIVWKIQNESSFIREDHITDKQLSYLKYLLSKNDIVLDIELEKIARKSASKVISALLGGETEVNELKKIIDKYC